MSTRTHYTPWESLRPSDGSPLVISFDWYEDHSAWRMEDLSHVIDAALAVLAAHGERAERPDHVHELAPLVTQLRQLHRDPDVSDAQVRNALELADELDVGPDAESYDAQDQYDHALEELINALSAWDEYNDWRWLDDEWYVNATRLLEKVRDSRHGLGERWKVVITDNWVELPDGTTVHGHVPSKPVDKLMNLIYEHIDREDDLAVVSPWLVSIDDPTTRRADLLLRAISEGIGTELDERTIRTVLDTAANPAILDEQLEQISTTVTALAGEWHQSFDELIAAATTLNTAEH